MTKRGSKGYASTAVATTGYVPVKSTVSFKSGGGGRTYQNKSQVSYGDKKSGCYGRETTTQKASAGDFQWKNGTTGTRSEYMERNTVRFGDKSGYTEVRNERTVRDVTYDRSGCSSNKYITYNNDNDGGSYGSESDDGDQSGGYDSENDGGGYDSEGDDGGESEDGGGYYSNSEDGCGDYGSDDGNGDDSDY